MMLTSNGKKINTSSGDKPVAIVTGGSGGIGAACCRELFKEGFCVGIHYRSSRHSAEDTLSQIQNSGFLLQADMADTDQVEQMVRRIKEEVGRVDVLVNNAGMSINESIHAMTIETFDAQRALLRGTWYLTRRILRMFMLRQSKGRIINISSVVGHTGNAGQIPYSMEKAAIDAMTKSLARELPGRDILVNSVAPGFIDTEMTKKLPGEIRQGILAAIPLGRMGKPEEVAEVVAFLSRNGSFVNGSVIHVNGGMYSG